MITNQKNYLFLFCIAITLLVASCGGNKIDISGAVQGAWKADWTEKNAKDGLGNLDVSETIAFVNSNEAGSAGKFRQIYVGTVEPENAPSQKVAFAIVVAGDWQVEDVNGLKLIYNLDNMSTVVGPGSLDGNRTAATTAMLGGDWNGSVNASLASNGSDALDSSTEDQIKRLLNTYFRNLFRDLNKEKVTFNDVVIEGKVMTAKVSGGLMGSKITYFKTDQNVSALGSQSQSQPQTQAQTQTESEVLPESSVAPLHSRHSSTPSGLPNYDWLSTRSVSYSDISGKSGSQLRIMRNYIYARHGYRFKSSDLQRYFAQYPWYSPMYSNVEHMLNKIERANVSYIKSYE